VRAVHLVAVPVVQGAVAGVVVVAVAWSGEGDAVEDVGRDEVATEDKGQEPEVEESLALACYGFSPQSWAPHEGVHSKRVQEVVSSGDQVRCGIERAGVQRHWPAQASVAGAGAEKGLR
jgi:hypothetical protein